MLCQLLQEWQGVPEAEAAQEQQGGCCARAEGAGGAARGQAGGSQLSWALRQHVPMHAPGKSTEKF